MKYANDELQLHKAALAGDADAKRAIEAKELLAKADRLALDLRDKAMAGDSTAMANLRQLANGTAGKTSKAWDANSNWHTIALAKSDAVDKERERMAKVFASPASRGRERGCAALLTAEQGWSAAAITAQLPSLPTDAELAGKQGRGA